MIGLGIESTAHTFSCAIIKKNGNKGKILSDVRKIYRPPGGEGIHPREASRHHIENSSSVLSKCLAEAKIKVKDIDIISTIDVACDGWDKKVGLCPNVLEALAPSPVNTIAITCGPPIMIKFTLQALDRLGFKEDMIYTTLERRMKCGVGKCGRCNIGEKFVCVDGPVFSLKELNEIPEPYM